jgi:hypothetical protein
VCGYRSIGSKTSPVNPRTAYVWTPPAGGVGPGGTFTDLGLIDGKSTEYRSLNEAGTVCGWIGATAGNGAQALLGPPENPVQFPFISGGTSSALTCVNATGVSGGHGRVRSPQGSGFANRAIVIESGVMRIIDNLPGFNASMVMSIGADGVVYCRASSPATGPAQTRAYASFGLESVDLTTLVDASVLSRVSEVGDVTDDGVLIGIGFTATNMYVAFVLTPVGESIGDLNVDCACNVTDLLMVIASWGQTGANAADANHDGVVDVADLLIVITHWST